MFPICGNHLGHHLDIPQGGFPMPRHGFARDIPWQLQLLNDCSSVGLNLRHSEANLAHYPFKFALKLRYLLEPSALVSRVWVEHLASCTAAMRFL
jgi:galactose mutarotase-like enzyme